MIAILISLLQNHHRLIEIAGHSIAHLNISHHNSQLEIQTVLKIINGKNCLAKSRRLTLNNLNHQKNILAKKNMLIKKVFVIASKTQKRKSEKVKKSRIQYLLKQKNKK